MTRRGTVATAVLLLTACEPSVALLDPEASDESDSVALSVVVGDPLLAERLGVAPGSGVPGATVHLRRNETPGVQSFDTDASGELRLADVPSALYWIWAEKWLGAERPPASPPVLGGGLLQSLKRGEAASVDVRPHQRGSLVISEFHYAHAPAEILELNTAYRFYFYIEITNESDETIYLDGKIVGGAFSYNTDSPAWPCSETAAYRNELRGLYAQSFQAFPGSGSEYPLEPGGVVVIAEQAIDHSAIYPGLPDLSGADFQFYWEDRALNPDVPTMLPIHLRLYDAMFSRLNAAPFIAEKIDLGSLERVSNIQGEFALFPREVILDMAAIHNEFQLVRVLSSLCKNFVDVSLDPLGAFASPSEQRPDAHLLSAQRKLLPDGSGLQRTGVSAVDWEIRPRSPGRIP
ncbi:MAG: hypothetical protein ACRD15_07035 [Vicinamibacterales bacterium]